MTAKHTLRSYVIGGSIAEERSRIADELVRQYRIDIFKEITDELLKCPCFACSTAISSIVKLRDGK